MIGDKHIIRAILINKEVLKLFITTNIPIPNSITNIKMHKVIQKTSKTLQRIRDQIKATILIGHLILVQIFNKNIHKRLVIKIKTKATKS